MIEFIISFWILLIIVLTFTKIEWGVSLFLAYMILVPVIHFSLGGVSVGRNGFSAIFLIGYFYNANKRGYTTTWRPLTPFVMYFVLTFIIMPLQNGVPFSTMIDTWRADVMYVMILPFVIWNLLANDLTFNKMFRNTLLIAIFIAVTYGIVLITLNGTNPYIMSLMGILHSEQDFESYYAAENGGRVFGRISSVFVHPMHYALFLGLALIFIFQLRHKYNKCLIIILTMEICLSVLTCGVRSVLGALIAVITYYFFVARNYKVMFSIIIILIVGYEIIETMPDFSAYIYSVADIHDKNEAVRGSSWEMRLSQLEGCIQEISSNPLFGLGYGWTAFYNNLHGCHPVILYFESLIFEIICNWGIMGFVIWGLFVYKYTRINRIMSVNEVVLFDCLIIFFITYTCITGLYDYMRNFFVFYILMLGNNFEISLTNFITCDNEKKSKSNCNVPSPIPSNTRE